MAKFDVTFHFLSSSLSDRWRAMDMFSDNNFSHSRTVSICFSNPLTWHLWLKYVRSMMNWSQWSIGLMIRFKTTKSFFDGSVYLLPSQSNAPMCQNNDCKCVVAKSQNFLTLSGLLHFSDLVLHNSPTLLIDLIIMGLNFVYTLSNRPLSSLVVLSDVMYQAKKSHSSNNSYSFL